MEVEGVALQVPEGALPEPVPLTVGRLPDVDLPQGAVPGTLVEVGPPGVTFQKPVQLTISYQRNKLPAGDTTWVRMVLLEGSGRPAATAFSSHDPVQGVLTAGVVKTGRYRLADLKLADALLDTKQTKVKDVDVLFVVDNSNSMENEQVNLANNFPKLIQRLEGAGLSYRVGVTSTNLGAGANTITSCEVPGGDGGKLLRRPGCRLPTEPWIARGSDGSSNVPGGDVASAFACMAQLGVGGCGVEHSLEAARRALDPQLGVNPGFLRSEAALAVVFITDEDDCSIRRADLFDPSQQGLNDPLGPLNSFRCTEFGLTCQEADLRSPGVKHNCRPGQDWLNDVQGYQSFFASLKPAGRTVMAAIAGPVSDTIEVGVDGGVDGGIRALKPSCSSVAGAGAPAIRIKAVVDSLGAWGRFNAGRDAAGQPVEVNICSADFSPALSFVGEQVVQKALTSWCLPFDAADTDPLTAGIQGDCQVTASRGGKLPPCSTAGSQPCYSLLPGSCGSSSTVLRVENLDPASLGEEVYAVCLAR